MIYLKKFDSHASYETEINGWGVDISLPNVSYCEDVKDVHYTPYNLVRFYVGDITGTTPQTVKIYTDNEVFNEVQVSEGNKWYSYVLPKDKSLCKIESGIYDGDSEEWYNGIVTKVVVKSNINYNYDENNNRYNGIVPWKITEASFKGSNTSKVTNMFSMFNTCSGLTSLDLSNFNTSNVTNMGYMFYYCDSLTSLDVSNFNTSNVIDMDSMFDECNSLTSLDLSSFDTSKVIRMDYMFNSCSGLKSLDLSGWDMSKVTNTTEMFNGCSNLLVIRMADCNKTTIDKIAAVKPEKTTIQKV